MYRFSLQDDKLTKKWSNIIKVVKFCFYVLSSFPNDSRRKKTRKLMLHFFCIYLKEMLKTLKTSRKTYFTFSTTFPERQTSYWTTKPPTQCQTHQDSRLRKLLILRRKKMDKNSDTPFIYYFLLGRATSKNYFSALLKGFSGRECSNKGSSTKVWHIKKIWQRIVMHFLARANASKKNKLWVSFPLVAQWPWLSSASWFISFLNIHTFFEKKSHDTKYPAQITDRYMKPNYMKKTIYHFKSLLLLEKCTGLSQRL